MFYALTVVAGDSHADKDLEGTSAGLQSVVSHSTKGKKRCTVVCVSNICI